MLKVAADSRVDRRQFFRLGAFAALAGVAPSAFAGLRAPQEPAPAGERDLRFYHTHTGESLRVVYWEAGEYLPESLAEVNHLLRDFRTNEVKAITPALLDLLHRVQAGLGTSEAFHVISAYRSPTTNQMLHEHSSGVASHSLHMDGLAIDVRVPGRDLRQLRQVAMAQQAGGVGFYPASQFVHLDVGRVRYW
ncbi:MAG: DUF882 domain-containing protein [Rhodocyclaceae bacterium]|nr:DUF882 domain-containing protein [Rhodocyclaceae bacterium]